MANYLDVAKSWLSNGYDVETQREVLEMMQGDPKMLEDAFYRTLEFGTGYIIPKPFDRRLKDIVPAAVAEAARRTGVARL